MGLKDRERTLLTYLLTVMTGYTFYGTRYLDGAEGEVREVKGRRSTSSEVVSGDERGTRSAGGRAPVRDETTLRSHHHLCRP